MYVSLWNPTKITADRHGRQHPGAARIHIADSEHGGTITLNFDDYTAAVAFASRLRSVLEAAPSHFEHTGEGIELDTGPRVA